MELRKVRLGDVGKIVTGKTPSTKNEEFFSGNIPFITPEDIAYGFRIDDSLRHLSLDGLDSIKSNSLNGFSVLVGCIGSDMGNVAYSEKNVRQISKLIQLLTLMRILIRCLYIICFQRKKIT